MNDEKVWVWGANNAGQLGLGFVSEQVSSPTQLLLNPEAATADHKCSNENDCLSTLQNHDALYNDRKILTIDGGGSHTLILQKLKSESSYQILTYGLISTKHQFPADSISFAISTEDGPVELPQIACGWDFSLYLSPGGEIYSAGDNNYGQLGRESSETNEKLCMTFSSIRLPIGIERCVQISAGLRHSASIGKTNNNDGSNCLIVWGDNSKGQLGLGSSVRVCREPTQIMLETSDGKTISPVKVRCGKYFTIVLGSDGHLYGCGLDKFGIFGKDTKRPTNNSTVWKLTELIFPNCNSFVGLKDFVCGWNHILALLNDGRIMSWGRNNFCQLGRSSTNPNEEFDGIPNYVEGLPDFKADPVSSISCGSEHNLVLTSSGAIYTWGWNEHENCGVKIKNGETDHVVRRPTLVQLSTANCKDKQERVVLVGCGAGNSFVITSSS